jgi:3-deoxy-D-manno-octulosonic-acid transferase
VSAAWWAARAAENAVGVLAETLGRPFLAPGRLGRVASPAPGGAWVHAASLGETLGVPALGDALRARAPGRPLYFTATSAAGLARLRAREGEAAGMAPLDAPWIARRFLDRLRPGIVLLVETELWPHWLLACDERRLPVAVVSARLRERSLRGYRRLGRRFRRLIGGLAAVLAQDQEQASRWAEAGVPVERVEVTGNLKWDAIRAGRPDVVAARRRLALDPDRPLLVLGSVRPGEAEPLARAWRALPAAVQGGWNVVLVPRHPAAAELVANEARAAGQAVAESGSAGGAGAWGLERRLGVLADYYAAADLAFVGGSLAPYGGHNPLEPAALGVPALMGASYETQRPAVAALLAAGALRLVASEADLRDAFLRLTGDEAERGRCGAAGIEAVRALQGVAPRTVERLAARGLWPPP